jgi:fructose-specific phosphotransferase system component IIB
MQLEGAMDILNSTDLAEATSILTAGDLKTNFHRTFRNCESHHKGVSSALETQGLATMTHYAVSEAETLTYYALEVCLWAHHYVQIPSLQGFWPLA